MGRKAGGALYSSFSGGGQESEVRSASGKKSRALAGEGRKGGCEDCLLRRGSQGVPLVGGARQKHMYRQPLKVVRATAVVEPFRRYRGSREKIEYRWGEDALKVVGSHRPEGGDLYEVS